MVGLRPWSTRYRLTTVPAVVPPPPSIPPVGPSRGAGQHFVTGLDPNGDNFLALKEAPNVSSRRLREMGPDTRLEVLGQQGNWLHVRLTDGTTGWAFNKYVACCKPAR